MNLKFSLNEVIVALLDNNESEQKDNHTGFFDSILIAQQPEKIQSPIINTLSGITALFNPRHPPKAQFSIINIPSANSNSFRFLHSKKASTPIFLTFSGIITFSNLSQPQKALSPSSTTFSGITKEDEILK